MNESERLRREILSIDHQLRNYAEEIERVAKRRRTEGSKLLELIARGTATADGYLIVAVNNVGRNVNTSATLHPLLLDVPTFIFGFVFTLTHENEMRACSVHLVDQPSSQAQLQISDNDTMRILNLGPFKVAVFADCQLACDTLDQVSRPQSGLFRKGWPRSRAYRAVPQRGL